ncbi:MAG: sterol desaturase family protein [Alphaproteobacteria bacterium]
MPETFNQLGEPAIRLIVFIGVFALMAVAEALRPRRPLVASKWLRWATNLSIIVIDSLFVRLVFPVVAVGVAIYAQGRGWGLFNLVDWPVWLEVVLAVVILDLGIYVQHVVSHAVPIFWRLHRVHHADRDIDVTTGARFHPIEIGLSMLYKMLLVLLLGPSAFAVFLFEVILNATAMFNHANFRLPLGVDRVVRLFMVTPDMHRVHHSVIQRETDSNYGFSLSVWDRLFGTYRDQPEAGHQDMTIGLAPYQHRGPTRLLWSLWLPFTNKTGE